MAITLTDTSKPPPSDVYMLPRNWMASNRLTTQHYVLNSRFGWLVHPKIATDLKSQSSTHSPPNRPLRIADVAAGNCIWTTEVLKEFPTAQITAFDLSTSQFPSPWTLPSNVTLETYDIFRDPPEKYLEYFDIVHVRLIIAAIQDGGRDLVLRNLISMLRPGGWFQWHEAANYGYTPVDPLTSLPVPLSPSKLPRFMQLIAQHSKIYDVMSHVDDSASVLRDVGGLLETENYHAPVKRELLRRETQCLLWVYDEMGSGPIAGVMSEGERREYRESIALEAERMAGGKNWAHDFVVSVGRKGSV